MLRVIRTHTDTMELERISRVGEFVHLANGGGASASRLGRRLSLHPHRGIKQSATGVVLSPRPLRASVGLPGKFRLAETLVPAAFLRSKRAASADSSVPTASHPRAGTRATGVGNFVSADRFRPKRPASANRPKGSGIKPSALRSLERSRALGLFFHLFGDHPPRRQQCRLVERLFRPDARHCRDASSRNRSVPQSAPKASSRNERSGTKVFAFKP
jgi:hypothetical protein